MEHLIGVVGFDAIASAEEVQKIICALLDTGYNLEIIKDPTDMIPKWSKWQIEISTDNKGVETQ